MKWHSVTILTNDAAHLRNALAARGITTTDMGGGVEVAEMPNPLITDAGDPPDTPPTYDTRRVFLLKLADGIYETDEDGNVTPDPGDGYPQFTKSKLAAWVKNNGTQTTLSDGTRAWVFANNKHWLIDPRDAAPFGAWQ